MIDISAVGSKVIISPSSGSPITITEFSDEGTPFDAGDIDVSTNAKNLNGQMISSRTPAVYPVSVSVIPGSDADAMLQQLLQKASIMPGGITPISDLKIASIVLSIPAVDQSGAGAVTSRSYRWTNGRIKSGPTGPSTSSEGRQSARTYTFEMEKFDGVVGAWSNVNS